jgi:hypothetical protein
MFKKILNFFNNNKEKNHMARTKQYVTYTREFTKGNVNSKIGVFVEPANEYIVKGRVNGGAIKFANLRMKRSTATTKLIDAGYDFNVRVLGTGTLQSSLALKEQLIGLLSTTNKTVINENVA